VRGINYFSWSVCWASVDAARCAASLLGFQGALLACSAYCSPGLPSVFSRATALPGDLLQVLLEGVRCVILYLSLLNFLRFLLAPITVMVPWSVLTTSSARYHLQTLRVRFVPSSNLGLVRDYGVCQLLIFLFKLLYFILGRLFPSNTHKLGEGGIISSAAVLGLFYKYDVYSWLSLLKQILVHSMDSWLWNLARLNWLLIIYY